MTSPWSSAALAVLQPRQRLTMSEWADRNRVVPPGTSPEPGPWRTSRIPYLREPMDAISDPAVERVAVMAASQVAKTELLLNAIGYFADADPSPILLVQPTETAMLSFSKERIAPMFRVTPALKGKLGETLRDPDNTIMLRQFPGGMLACAWATSASSLASRPIRVLLMDEVDRFPATTGRDGDPIAQAEQRTSNFHNRKIVLVSTPNVAETSPIERAFGDSDQRRFWMPCLRCGAYQVLQWSGIRYKNAAGNVDLDNVHYICAHCGGRIEERDRPEMLELGQWRPDSPGHRTRGYHISALYSPWVRWAELAAQWVKANANRDKVGLQEFVNLRLGEPWHDKGTRVEADSLEKNREPYEAEVPQAAVLLTCGVDVQDNRLELEIVGWGVGKESWGIQYKIIPGDTSTPAPWAALDEFLSRSWRREDSVQLGIWRVCVDSGGHRADEVYSYCAARMPRFAAIKGRGGPGIPITTGKPTIVGDKRCLLYIVGADAAKDAVYGRLVIEEAGPGYCHFPADPATGYDGEYFRGLCSERRKRRTRAGRHEMIWVQHYQRNEPLDARCYATAGLELALLVDGVNLERLATELGGQSAGPRPAAPPRPARRRVLSRGVGA